MYKNYGDKKFFEYGLLIDDEHSDTIFEIIFCNPYCDEEDLYQFGHIQVDITASWIDWDKVYSFCDNMKDPEPIDKAIMAYLHYGAYEFSPYNPFGNWEFMKKADIKKELKGYLIAHDDVCFD